jgi:hypothetical protein
MQEPRRIRHDQSFEEWLAEEAHRFREAADALPPGTAQELLLRRARQAENAAQIYDSLKLPSRQSLR